MNNSLEFSFNWNNKLDCKYFTTLRLSGRFEVGNWVDIWLKHIYKGRGVVVDKRQLKVSQLNQFICGLDTGYSVQETIGILSKMYPEKIALNTSIYLYLIRYETDIEKKERQQAEQTALNL